MVPLSLSHLTALDVEPLRLFDLAAAAGYQDVGLRVLPAAPGGISYPLTAAAVPLWRHGMQQAGVGLYDVEFVALTPDVDVRAVAPMLELAGQLGAKRLNVSGDDENMNRLVENFATLCDVAGEFGIGVDLEFMKFRVVGTLPHALEVVTRAAKANGRLLIDMLHLHRSGGTPEMLREVPAQFIGSVQLCDAPALIPPTDQLTFEAREARLFPGEGELPLQAYLGALPRGVPMGVEVPTRSTWPNLSALECATRGANGARTLLKT